MKVLVLGDDGRAHAITWKLFDSAQVTELICAPGNGGTSQLVPQLDLRPEQVANLVTWAFDEQVDLVVPASSAALHAGLVDEALAMGLRVCGPVQRSAHPGQSICFSKELLLRHNLPTARGQTFTHLPTAERYLAAQPLPLRIRADHPLGGQAICHERYAALTALRELFHAPVVDGRNEGVVIESFLPGVSVSFSAFTDGTTALPLLPVRLYDQLSADAQSDHAPGMGAHTGISTYYRKLTDYLQQHVMLPLVAALEQEQLPYRGLLGVDCVITKQGPRIVALRSSLRDMEAQVVLPRLLDDLLPVMQATVAGRLAQLPPLRWRDEVSLGLALVAQGYPHHFPVGGTVGGLADVEPGVLVFHDQTHNPLGLHYELDANHKPGALSRLLMGLGKTGTTITTTGGHVLAVVALGTSLHEARARARANAERITFNGRFFREDIGLHELT
jgi:phosphoribosylamine--glycine ligase